jgi:hypothetical protein
VYHKRRIDWQKFYTQVYKFGLVRPVLNKWHPASAKLTFWFPTLFSAGFVVAVFLAFFGFFYLLLAYAMYLIILFIHSLAINYSLSIAVYSVWAALVQFSGYGLGFWLATYYIRILNQDPEKRFPKLFFQNAQKDQDSHPHPV